MAVYKIFKNGKEINRIVATEDYCQEHYGSNGYSYEIETLEENADKKQNYEEDSVIIKILDSFIQ